MMPSRHVGLDVPGLLSFLRNEGGSIGTSLAETMQERRDQFQSRRLGELLDPFNAAVRSSLDQASGPFLQQTGDPVAAQQLALQALATLRQQRASALALLRCVLGAGRCHGRANVRRAADETLRRRKGRPDRSFCRGDDSHVGGWLCIGVGGVGVDRAVAAQIVEAVSERAVEAALQAANQSERADAYQAGAVPGARGSALRSHVGGPPL
jgi:hypothetical protein